MTGGATRNVAANVKRLRKQRGWTLAQLSAHLEERGHRLGVPVLSKIELGDRGIDVDDLAAFAAVFVLPVSHLLADPALAADAKVMQLLDRYGELAVERQEAVRSIDAERASIQARLAKVLDVDWRPTHGADQ